MASMWADDSGVPTASWPFRRDRAQAVAEAIAQEALHNAVKYSEVSEFAVVLSETADTIQLLVVDRGAGFDVEEVKKEGGLGLVSMQERAHLVHGTVVVESKPGEGTKITAVVPLAGVNPESLDNERDDQIANMTGVV